MDDMILNDEQADRQMAKYDTNKDGKVSKEEFIDSMRKMFKVE